MKRILAMMLSIVLIFGVSAYSSAQEITANGQQQTVELTYEVAAELTFVIPDSTVTLSSSGAQLPFYLSKSGNINSATVSIESAHSFCLVNSLSTPSQPIPPIGYTLWRGPETKIDISNPTIVVSKEDTINYLGVVIEQSDRETATAGTYTDTLTFTIQAN